MQFFHSQLFWHWKILYPRDRTVGQLQITMPSRSTAIPLGVRNAGTPRHISTRSFQRFFASARRTRNANDPHRIEPVHRALHEGHESAESIFMVNDVASCRCIGRGASQYQWYELSNGVGVPAAYQRGPLRHGLKARSHTCNARTRETDGRFSMKLPSI